MELHYICNRQALSEVGVTMDKETYFNQAGMTGMEQIRYFCERDGVKTDHKQVYRRKKELFTEYIDKIKPIESNIMLLKLLQENNIPVAIATGSSLESLKPAMEKCDLTVDVFVSSNDVTRGKPHPDLFLLAAKKLNVEPENCIVIEDSDTGIQAAAAAGMSSYMFRRNKQQKDESDDN